MKTAAEQIAEDQEELDQSEAEALRREQIQIFGSGLLKLASDQVAQKAEIEKRWVDDLRHYNGRYDRETDDKLTAAKKKTSTVFVNITRAKTNQAEAKLGDMIFPTDDSNWGIKPTPVPDLMGRENDDSPVILANGATAMREDGSPYAVKDMVQIAKREAEERAEKMQREIEDQLVETGYNAVGRDVIHNASVLGTGILKGPMIVSRDRKSWQKVGTQYAMTLTRRKRPMAASVDPWNFFPDMSATCWDDVEFVFERHLLTKKKVRDLAKRPGFDVESLREVLREKPSSNRTNLQYVNEIREINGIAPIRDDNRYEIWEYHGPISKSDLEACGCKVDSDDPMQEFEGVVWFCGTHVLKVGLNHLDDNSLPYSVFCWEKDDASVFGFGVPYRMRSSQRVMNGSWRMLLDNAGLSTGPQIIVNQRHVHPADNKWELAPRKLWYVTSDKVSVNEAFATFEVNSHQQELAAIFEMAHALAEEETNIPQIGNQLAQENQPAVMKTLGGTALWMSSQNITYRRAVKNWDDDVTVPFINRMYDYNMQFSEKDDIKGDFDVDARGTSVLLVKEMQVRNMMEFVQIALSIPGGQEKLDGEGILETLAKSMQVPEDTILKSREDLEAEAAEQAGQEPPPDPEMLKLQTQERIATMSLQEKQIETEGRYQEKLIDRDIALVKVASEERRDVQAIQKDYNIKSLDYQWDREKFYQEIGIKRQQGIDANFGLGE